MDILNKMREVFAGRKDQYKGAILKITILRQNNAEHLYFGSLEFTDRIPDPETKQSTRDYGELLLVKKILPVNKAWNFAEDLANCKSPTGYKFLFKNPDFKEPDWTRSWDHLPSPIGVFRYSAWPSRDFVICNKDANVGPPNGPLPRIDLPLLINPREDIENWIGVEYSKVGSQNALLVSMPDYRARISEIVFGEEAVVVSIKEGFLNSYHWSAKSSVDGQINDQITLENHSYGMKYENLPRKFDFFLFDKDNGDVVDWASIYLGSSNLPKEVSFASPRKRMQQLIENGESNILEFKEKVGDGFTLIQSVVAFANTSGGTILIGVKDDCSIAGCADTKGDQDRIEEWLEKRCDPPASIEFEEMELDGKKLLAIHVASGQRLYQHRDNGVFYVRRGANDRPIRRSELDIASQKFW